jgi:D-glycero-alpha-D-manno-heptose-7-phosphate kinase
VIGHARAPLRIDLAGGWTDVAPYAEATGGAVVNVAIDLHAHVQVRPRRGGVSLHALDLGAAVTARRADELRPDGEFGLLKAAARRYGPAGGFEVVTSSEAPAGSGLGGSGAMGVALVAAFAALRGERPMAAEVAQRAFDLEATDVGILGGRQDQYAAALGGCLWLEFGDPAVSATRLALPADVRRELERHLVLCYTGVSRLSAAMHAGVWSRYRSGDAATAGALDGLRACAFAMRDALLAGDLPAVAEVLARNWTHQRALGEGMETERMRELQRAATAAGAAGAKACGAGAGGCMVFLARAGKAFAVAEALRHAGATVLRSAFDADGVVAWAAGER